MSELGAARWVDTLLNEYWDALQDAGVPRDDLPAAENVDFTERQPYLPGMRPQRLTRPKRLTFKEFGCGHYGCVMPTIGNPDVVVKLTSDFTEAMFVGHLLSDTPQPETGLVRYDRILALPSRELRRGRTLFLIWREEAQFVGDLQPPYVGRGQLPDYKIEAIRRGAIYHRVYIEAASIVKLTTERMVQRLTGSKSLFTDDPRAAELYQRIWDAHQSERYHRDIHSGIGWKRLDVPDTWSGAGRGVSSHIGHYRGFERILYALDIAAQAATELNNIDQWYTIGTAFSQMLEEGFLLADVHFGNLGLDMDGAMTVTDPGHVVPLNPERAQIPRIEAV